MTQPGEGTEKSLAGGRDAKEQREELHWLLPTFCLAEGERKDLLPGIFLVIGNAWAWVLADHRIEPGRKGS